MKQTKAMRVLAALKMKGPSVIKTSMWKGETCSNDDRCHHGVRTAVACLHRPEADDGAFLADVALGLVLGGLSGSHAVQDGQPHHRLRLQAHPVQEHGSLQLGFIVGLDTETDKKTLMVCKKWKKFTQTFTMAPYLSLCSRINLRAFCFSCRPIWFKIWNLNILLDFRDPEDNDSQALYSDWTLNLILSKTSQHSKTFNSRKEIRHFWLNAKLTDPLAQIVSGASNMD